MASALATRRSQNASCRLTSPSSVTSQKSCTWKLPSPTWPTIGPKMPWASMSFCVSTTHSASREIGTQTSLASGSEPGRSAFAAQ